MSSELDRRQGDGIDVRLLWSQADDRIVVAVFHAKTGDTFDLQVSPYRAPDKTACLATPERSRFG